MVTSSGSVGAHIEKACSTSPTAGPTKNIAPPKNRGTANRSSSIEETIPKPRWPPRTAQNSSGSLAAVICLISPSAVTISTERTWSAANPCRRARCPIPPPRVYPTTPTPDDDPDSGARPWGTAASITLRHRAPAATRATRATGSTSTPCMLLVVTNTVPSDDAAAPCPVAWTATWSPSSWANRTAAEMSAASSAASTTAGRWVTAVLNPAVAIAVAAASPPSCTAPDTRGASRSRMSDMVISSPLVPAATCGRARSTVRLRLASGDEESAQSWTSDSGSGG